MLSMLLILISANAQTLRGDVNGDGKVDASDVSDLVTIILNAGLTEDDIYKKYNRELKSLRFVNSHKSYNIIIFIYYTS